MAKVDLCDKTCRAHSVLAICKMYDDQDFLKKTFSVSLEKYFIFRFHICFSATFPFCLLYSDAESEISMMVSFNI